MPSKQTNPNEDIFSANDYKGADIFSEDETDEDEDDQEIIDEIDSILDVESDAYTSKTIFVNVDEIISPDNPFMSLTGNNIFGDASTGFDDGENTEFVATTQR